MQPVELLYHIALQVEFDHQQPTYEPASFLDVGYIRCGTLVQVGLLLNALDGQGDCLLLEIDPSEVDSEIRWEYEPSDNQTYAHIFGPIALQAIQSAMPIEPEVEVTARQLADLDMEEAKRLLSNDE